MNNIISLFSLKVKILQTDPVSPSCKGVEHAVQGGDRSLGQVMSV